MQVRVFDINLEIKENSIIFFSDIPRVESDYLHKIRLDDIVKALIDIGVNPIWCNNGDSLVVKDLQSSTLKCSSQNMKFAIGSKGRNINDTLDRINYEHKNKIANLSVKQTTESLIKAV